MANLVTFAKKLWKDATSGGTPITAAELNRIEGGVNDCATQINKLGDSVSRTNVELVSFDQENDSVLQICVGSYVIWFNAENGVGIWDSKSSTGRSCKWDA